jgi:hypothetical protein
MPPPMRSYAHRNIKNVTAAGIKKAGQRISFWQFRPVERATTFQV